MEEVYERAEYAKAVGSVVSLSCLSTSSPLDSQTWNNHSTATPGSPSSLALTQQVLM
jgi:hypothetical protein